LKLARGAFDLRFESFDLFAQLRNALPQDAILRLVGCAAGEEQFAL